MLSAENLNQMKDSEVTLGTKLYRVNSTVDSATEHLFGPGSVRSTDLLILNVQVESEKPNLKKHMKTCSTFSLCSNLLYSPQTINIYLLNINLEFYLRLTKVLY